MAPSCSARDAWSVSAEIRKTRQHSTAQHVLCSTVQHVQHSTACTTQHSMYCAAQHSMYTTLTLRWSAWKPNGEKGMSDWMLQILVFFHNVIQRAEHITLFLLICCYAESMLYTLWRQARCNFCKRFGCNSSGVVWINTLWHRLLFCVEIVESAVKTWK